MMERIRKKYTRLHYKFRLTASLVVKLIGLFLVFASQRIVHNV